MTDFYADYDYMKEVTNEKGAEIIDCYDGCLIDNLLVATDSGCYFFKESYVNCYESNYQVFFFRNNETDKAFDLFYKCQAEYEALTE